MISFGEGFFVIRLLCKNIDHLPRWLNREDHCCLILWAGSSDTQYTPLDTLLIPVVKSWSVSHQCNTEHEYLSKTLFQLPPQVEYYYLGNTVMLRLAVMLRLYSYNNIK